MKKFTVVIIIIAVIQVAFICFVLSFPAMRIIDGLSKYQANAQKVSSAKNEILYCLEHGDNNRLYEMFAQHVKNDPDRDLINRIDQLFSKYDITSFDFSKVRYHDNGGGESYREGNITYYEYEYIFGGITGPDGSKFVISYGYSTVNEDHRDKTGLLYLRLRKVEYTGLYTYEILEDYKV